MAERFAEACGLDRMRAAISCIWSRSTKPRPRLTARCIAVSSQAFSTTGRHARNWGADITRCFSSPGFANSAWRSRRAHRVRVRAGDSFASDGGSRSWAVLRLGESYLAMPAKRPTPARRARRKVWLIRASVSSSNRSHRDARRNARAHFVVNLGVHAGRDLQRHGHCVRDSFVEEARFGETRHGDRQARISSRRSRCFRRGRRRGRLEREHPASRRFDIRGPSR
jgi:hypothetical protein